VTTTLNDRHVAPLPGGLINSLSVTGTLFTPMDKPAADANNAWRGIPGPRVATLVPNYTRIPHVGRLPLHSQGPQADLAPEGD